MVCSFGAVVGFFVGIIVFVLYWLLYKGPYLLISLCIDTKNNGNTDTDHMYNTYRSGDATVSVDCSCLSNCSCGGFFDNLLETFAEIITVDCDGSAKFCSVSGLIGCLLASVVFVFFHLVKGFCYVCADIFTCCHGCSGSRNSSCFGHCSCGDFFKNIRDALLDTLYLKDNCLCCYTIAGWIGLLLGIIFFFPLHII